MHPWKENTLLGKAVDKNLCLLFFLFLFLYLFVFKWKHMCFIELYSFLTNINLKKCVVNLHWFRCMAKWFSYIYININIYGFPGGSDGKEPACNAGDLGPILGLRTYPGEGSGNPLQDSCLENSMDRGAWQTLVHGVAESYTPEQLTLSLSYIYSS